MNLSPHLVTSARSQVHLGQWGVKNPLRLDTTNGTIRYISHNNLNLTSQFVSFVFLRDTQ